MHSFLLMISKYITQGTNNSMPFSAKFLITDKWMAPGQEYGHSTFYEKAKPNINAAFSKSLWLFSVIPNKLCWQRWSGCDNRVIYTNAVLCIRFDLCTCIPVSFISPYRVWNRWKYRKRPQQVQITSIGQGLPRTRNTLTQHISILFNWSRIARNHYASTKIISHKMKSMPCDYRWYK